MHRVQRFCLTRIPVRCQVALVAITALFLAADSAHAAKKRPGKGRNAARPHALEVSDGDASEQTIDAALDLARESRKQLDAVKDYAALFTKVEKVRRKTIEQTMEIKYRNEPLSIYLRFRSGKEEGREVIYVAGENGNRLLVHEQGLLGSLTGTLSLGLDDATVKAENRYPITEIGIAKIIDNSITAWEGERKAGSKETRVRFVKGSHVKPRGCDIIEVEHSRENQLSEFSRTRLFLDQESKLPVRLERFSRPNRKGEEPELVEMYDYDELKVNVGLTDADFDPKNPAYRF